MNHSWSIIALRRTAASLLSREEYAALEIHQWDSSWNKKIGLFSRGTVARYRRGVLVVRPAAGINPDEVLRHELGHHLALHSSGRYYGEMASKMEHLPKGKAAIVRGLSEGVADRIAVELGGVANGWYEQKAANDSLFGAGYWAGRE